MLANMMIRLDVEAMRYQVVHAFAEHSKEIQDEISAGVEAQLKGFDFATIVREECQKVIRESVRSAVAAALSTVMWQEPIKGIIKAGAERKVREAIEDSLK